MALARGPLEKPYSIIAGVWGPPWSDPVGCWWKEGIISAQVEGPASLFFIAELEVGEKIIITPDDHHSIHVVVLYCFVGISLSLASSYFEVFI